MINDSDSCVGRGSWKRWFCCVDDIGALFFVVLYLMTVVSVCSIIYLIFFTPDARGVFYATARFAWGTT